MKKNFSSVCLNLCSTLQRDELGYSALHHASIAGLRDVVEVLIQGGEDVDGKGQDGSTPLRYIKENNKTKEI